MEHPWLKTAHKIGVNTDFNGQFVTDAAIRGTLAEPAGA